MHVKGNPAYISTHSLWKFSGAGVGWGNSSSFSASTKFLILLLTCLLWFFSFLNLKQLFFSLMPFVYSPFLQRVWDSGDCIASEHSKFFKTTYEISLLISRLRYSQLFPPVWEFLLSSPLLDPLLPALCLYLPISSINLFCPYHLSLPLETYFFLYYWVQKYTFLGLNGLPSEQYFKSLLFHHQWLFKAFC